MQTLGRGGVVIHQETSRKLIFRKLEEVLKLDGTRVFDEVLKTEHVHPCCELVCGKTWSCELICTSPHAASRQRETKHSYADTSDGQRDLPQHAPAHIHLSGAANSTAASDVPTARKFADVALPADPRASSWDWKLCSRLARAAVCLALLLASRLACTSMSSAWASVCKPQHLQAHKQR